MTKRIGDYEILKVLGTGGMGRVFKVRNVLSDRIEAMKVLLPDLADKKELADRFLREIKVLAALDHPNICELRTALTLNNQLIMIMEYVEGETLATRLEHGPLRIADALDYVEQVLAALSYAHQQHVIHRDIKPGNMMLTPEGLVKLTDFGIARSGNDARLTMTGTTLGSLYYMAPEQIKGEPIDERADLYSVGVSLYEFVTGQRPFQADSDFSIMAAHLQQAPKPPIELRPELPKGLDEIILKALAKDPADRFQSADAFSAALANIRERGNRVTAPSAGPETGRPLAPTALFPDASPGLSSKPDSVSAGAPLQPDVRSVDEPPRQPVPHNGYRGFYMTAGVVIVVVVLVVAGIYWPHSSKPVKAGGEKPPAVQAQPDLQNPSQVSNASNPADNEPDRLPSETPQVLSPENESVGSPKGNSATATVAKVTVPQQRGRRDRHIPSGNQTIDSASNRADAHELLALQQQEDKLDSRANAVNETLDHMRQRQNADGWPLRGDIASAQSLMNTDLKRARTALQSKDATTAKGYLGSAETELAKLEKILNLEPNP